MFFYFMPTTIHSKYGAIIYHLLHNLFVLSSDIHEHNVGGLMQDCSKSSAFENLGQII